MLAHALRKALCPTKPLSWGEAFVLAASASLLSLAALLGLYLAKSALGINLIPGPSPLHDMLSWALT